MENLELTCFQIISNVGMAKSSYIEAIKEAKNGNFDLAQEKIKEGDDFFVQGHTAHADMITKEANGESVTTTLLLVHSEDQLMGAEMAKVMALELIDSYKRIVALEARQK
ncbi:MAG: PTS lactose/cellobiose transporter subunit IIA [Erysipelotrichaceae bacterium]|uniref:PTS lactose/cellobiose transporter subunit IIA n=1 Tax=Floccifex sp. TaxID=2815810 RepID=UPI002A760530|nr:PTS lactose/cellobiose transporter subunit IIA [Floccifex sp.]MDD7282093.1 PTS lactose/cellobiose transporter subunit IIA [Erysipelotrichaceae bacterium]MDY2958773.1 PTS lactose/cellobiose transporter subunit IIA [Floccifex sp.]